MENAPTAECTFTFPSDEQAHLPFRTVDEVKEMFKREQAKLD
jgi:hypothetical protein